MDEPKNMDGFVAHPVNQALPPYKYLTNALIAKLRDDTPPFRKSAQ